MSFKTGLLDLREREGKKMKAKSEIMDGFFCSSVNLLTCLSRFLFSFLLQIQTRLTETHEN